MRFTEAELKEIIKLKKSIRLMKFKQIITFVIISSSFVMYFFSKEASLALIAISIISFAELSLSNNTNSLIELAERLINSDAENLKIKARISQISMPTSK